MSGIGSRRTLPPLQILQNPSPQHPVDPRLISLPTLLRKSQCSFSGAYTSCNILATIYLLLLQSLTLARAAKALTRPRLIKEGTKY